jgi:hypothetical protein
MGSSRRFASTANDRPFLRMVLALFRLGFPMAPPLSGLTKPQTVTRRIIMQKARRHTNVWLDIVLRPLVGTWFQVQYPPLAGVLPIFQSPY